MSISAGLVGLPNVGKSTLFNALTQSSVPAENYPFCTINPHLACTFVPDPRISKLRELYQSKKELPSTVQFVDIAGLVKGAASGEGLGNQFLSHIREVDLILHVLRCFEDPNIANTQHEINPVLDYEIIITELMLKDLESVTKRRAKVANLMKAAQQKPAELKELTKEADILERLEGALNASDYQQVKRLGAELSTQKGLLLSTKNFLIIANVAEHEIANNEYEKNKAYQQLVTHFGKDSVIPVCAKLEYELSQLDEQDAAEMAQMMGLTQRGLPTIIQQTYKNLGLITFFTCGPQEIHAWPIRKGITVRQAAGEIHSDLEKGFICAEVFNCQDLFELKTEAKLRDTGKIRTEGNSYIVQDGDIVLIKFNV